MDCGYRKENLEELTTSYYAVVIFLPRAIDMLVAELREKFDPDYSIINSHITVVFPFEASKSLEEISHSIQQVTSFQKSFKVKLSSIDDFYPNQPIIYWKTKENEIIEKLYFDLYSNLRLAMPFKKIIPHVTIGREISHHRLMLVKEKIVSYLPDEKFLVEAVDLVAPVSNQNWVSVRTFHLLPDED